jgi:hypothetical protein
MPEFKKTTVPVVFENSHQDLYVQLEQKIKVSAEKNKTDVGGYMTYLNKK